MTARLLVTGAGGGPAENLIRSLRAGDASLVIAGCHHDRFALKTSAAESKYLIPAPTQRGFARALHGVVSREKIDLIVPTSDADVRAVARLRRALSCRVFLPRARVIELCRDKYRLNEILRSHGVAVPLTYPVRSLAGIDAIFRRLQPASMVWCRIRTGHGALGALAVKTPAQARAWIDYWGCLQGVRADAFTLAEYLPGRDFSCQSLWCEGRLVLTKTFERVTPFSGQPGAASVLLFFKHQRRRRGPA